MERLLRWGIENSVPAAEGQPPPERKTDLTPELLAQLMGMPDSAQLMKEAMSAIEHPEVSLEDKEIAFENLMELVEQIDNANNLENLGLWPPLLKQFEREEASLRMWAAWTCGAATQNNPKTQERFLQLGGVEKVVRLAREDPSLEVRLKCVYAVSSAVRNHEKALEKALEHLPEHITEGKKYDPEDMDAISGLMGKMREEAKKLEDAGKKEEKKEETKKECEAVAA